MDDFEQRVRERAYHLWIEDGSPAGRAADHWERARELVENELRGQISSGEVAPPADGEGRAEEPTFVGVGTAPLAPGADPAGPESGERPASSVELSTPAADQPSPTRIRRAAATRTPSSKKSKR